MQLVILLVAPYLDPSSLHNCCISKTIQQLVSPLARNEYFWKLLCERSLGCSIDNKISDWKRMYYVLTSHDPYMKCLSSCSLVEETFDVLGNRYYPSKVWLELRSPQVIEYLLQEKLLDTDTSFKYEALLAACCRGELDLVKSLMGLQEECHCDCLVVVLNDSRNVEVFEYIASLMNPEDVRHILFDVLLGEEICDFVESLGYQFRDIFNEETMIEAPNEEDVVQDTDSYSSSDY